MPSEPTLISLNELASPDTPITYGVVQPGPEDPNGVKFVRGGDVFQGRILANQLRTISIEVSNQYKRTILRGGEVLVSLVGNPGEVAIVPPELAGANIARQVGLIRLRADVDAEYVKYFLMSPQGRAALGAQSLGSVQQVINLRDLKRVEVPLPSIDDQQAIAHVLSALDEKIELNRRLIETLEGIAQALFQSWFVDFDPVRAKTSGESPESICQRLGLTPELLQLFPDRLAESGEIPEGWNFRPLDQIATYLNGLALQKFPPTSDDEWLPVIKIAQLKSGSVVGADRASHELKPEYIVNDGDVLFSWSGSLEVDMWCNGPGALNQHLFKVTSKQYPKWFYFLWTKHHLASFRAIAAGKAVTMGHIQRKHLTEALCAVPSEAIIEAASTLFAPMFLDKIEIRKQSRELSAIRDALLPKLLSGEIQIPEGEML